MIPTNGEDHALLLVKSTSKCLSSTAVSMLEYTPVDYNLENQHFELPKETTQMSRKLTKIIPPKTNTTMKPHWTQKIVMKTTHRFRR